MDELLKKAAYAVQVYDRMGYNNLTPEDKRKYQIAKDYIARMQSRVKEEVQTQNSVDSVPVVESKPVDIPVQTRTQPVNVQPANAPYTGQRVEDNVANNAMAFIKGGDPTRALEYISKNTNTESGQEPDKSQKEQQFQQWWNSNQDVLTWRKAMIAKYKEDPSPDNPNYDYRRAWESGITPKPVKDDNIPHWGSIDKDGKDLKGVNHPTLWKSDYIERFGMDPDEAGLTKEEAISRLFQSHPGSKPKSVPDEGRIFNPEEEKWLKSTYEGKRSNFINPRDPEFEAKKNFVGRVENIQKELDIVESQLKDELEQQRNNKGTQKFKGMQMGAGSGTLVLELSKKVEDLKKRKDFYSQLSNYDHIKQGVNHAVNLILNGRTGDAAVDEFAKFFMYENKEEKVRNILKQAGYDQMATDEVIQNVNQVYQDHILSQQQRRRKQMAGIRNVDLEVMGRTTATLNEYLNDDEWQIAKLNSEIISQVSAMRTRPPNVKDEMKLQDLKNKLAVLQPKERQFSDLEAGKRVIDDPNKGPEYTQQVNENMDRMRADQNIMRSNLRQVLIEAELKLENLQEQKKKDAQINGVTLGPNPNAIYTEDIHEKIKESPKLNDMLWAASAEYEAALRLYYLNEQPTQALKPTFGERVNDVVTGLIGKEMLADGKNGTFTTDLMTRKEATRKILEKTTGYVTSYEQKGLETTFGDMVWPAIGGVGNMAIQFAVGNKIAKVFGVTQYIKGLRESTAPGNIGKFERAAGFIADMAYNEVLFEQIGGKPMEGATFMVGMEGVKWAAKGPTALVARSFAKLTRNRLTPAKALIAMNILNEAAWKSKPMIWAANTATAVPVIAGDAISSGLSLTLANNSIEIGKAIGRSLFDDSEFRYEMGKIYGATMSEAMMKLESELISNLVFGLWHFPERINGINEQYKQIVDKELPYYERLYKIYTHYGLKPQADALEKIINWKHSNKIIWAEKKNFVEQTQKHLKTYAMYEMSDAMRMDIGFQSAERERFENAKTAVRRQAMDLEQQKLNMTDREADMFDAINELFVRTLPDGLNRSERYEYEKKFWKNPLAYVEEAIKAIEKDANDEGLPEESTESKLKQTQAKNFLNRLTTVKDVLSDKNILTRYQSLHEKLGPIINKKDFTLEELAQAEAKETEYIRHYNEGEEVLIKKNGVTRKVRIIQDATSDQNMILVQAGISDLDKSMSGRQEFINREDIIGITSDRRKDRSANETDELIKQSTLDIVRQTDAEIEASSLEENIKQNKKARLFKLHRALERYEGRKQMMRDNIRRAKAELQDAKFSGDQDLIKQKSDELTEAETLLAQVENREPRRTGIKKTVKAGRVTAEEKRELKLSPTAEREIENGKPRSEVYQEEKKANKDAISELEKKIEDNPEVSPDLEKVVKSLEKTNDKLDKEIEERKLQELAEAKKEAEAEKIRLEQARKEKERQVEEKIETEFNEKLKKASQLVQENHSKRLERVRSAEGESARQSIDRSWAALDRLEKSISEGKTKQDFYLPSNEKKFMELYSEISEPVLKYMGRFMRDYDVWVQASWDKLRNDLAEERIKHTEEGAKMETRQEMFEEDQRRAKEEGERYRKAPVNLTANDLLNEIGLPPVGPTRPNESRYSYFSNKLPESYSDPANPMLPWNFVPRFLQDKIRDFVTNNLDELKILALDEYGDFTKMVVERIFTEESQVSNLVIPARLESFLNVARNGKLESYQFKTIRFGDLPEKLRTSLLSERNRYIDNVQVREWMEGLKSKIKENAAESKQWFIQKTNDLIIPKEEREMENFEEIFSNTIDRAEAIIRNMDRGIIGDIAKRLRAKGVKFPKETLMDIMQSEVMQKAIIDEAGFEENMKELAKDMRSIGTEDAIARALVFEEFIGSDKFDHSTARSLIAYYQSYNPVEIISYMVKMSGGTNNPDAIARIYANQKQREQVFITTIEQWLAHLNENLKKTGLLPDLLETSLMSERENEYNSNAALQLVDWLKANTNKEVTDGLSLYDANMHFGRVLYMLTGIPQNIWATYFKLETDADYVRGRINGRNVIPAIIENLKAQIWGPNVQAEFIRDYANTITRAIARMSVEDMQKQHKTTNSYLKILVNVASDRQHMAYDWYDKDNKSKPAVELASFFTTVLKNINSDKYSSPEYADNKVVKLWRQRSRPDLADYEFDIRIKKIGRIFTKATESSRAKEITYDGMAEQDLRRIAFFEFLSNNHPDSYSHFYRVFYSKKQLYLLEAPIYADPEKSWEKKYASMSEESKSIGWYSSKETLEQKIKEFTEQMIWEWDRSQYRNLRDDLIWKAAENRGDIPPVPKGETITEQVKEQALRERTDAMDKVMRQKIRDYVYTYALNTMYFDELYIGRPDLWIDRSKPKEKQTYEKLVKTITKRLGSINSSGQRPVISDDPRWKGLRSTENHLAIGDIMPLNPLAKSDEKDKRFELANGMILSFDEHMDRMGYSLGRLVTHPLIYPDFNCSKDIWYDLNTNMKPSLTKGNRHRISMFVKDSPETNKLKMIFDYIQKYNEGKPYEEQIHSISFGPSSTKISGIRPDSPHADKNGFLKMFGEDGSLQSVPYTEMEKFIERRSNETLFYQQDLRNETRADDAKTPTQERGNLSMFIKSFPDRMRLHNQVASEIVNDRIVQFRKQYEAAKESVQGMRVFKKFILDLTKNNYPDLAKLIDAGVSVNDPYIRRFVDTFVTADFTNKTQQEQMNRVSLQEIANLTGHDLRSFRDVQDKDVKGDIELGIGPSEKNGTRMLLPEFDQDIDGARYGQWFRYRTASELEEYRAIKEAGFRKRNPTATDEEVKKMTDKWWNSLSGMRERKDLGMFTRKETYDHAVKEAKKYNDLHNIGDNGMALPEVNTFEIEEVKNGENNEKGNFFYVPGEIVKASRIPGHDITSHTVGRLRKRASDPKYKMNYFMAPNEIILAGGSDYDGDKRYVEVLYKKGKNALLNMKSDDPTERMQSQRNAALLMLAKEFRKKAISPIVNEELTIDIYSEFLEKYKIENESMDNMDGLMNVFESQRLLSGVIGIVVSSSSTFDFIRQMGLTLKPRITEKIPIDTRLSRSVRNAPVELHTFKVGNNVYDPIDKEYKKISFEINGFTSDPHHVIKKHIGVIENIALDNKDDLYRLGITEHTASLFMALLMGDKNLGIGTKEEVEKKVTGKIRDIVTFMHSPLVRRYVEFKREAENIGQYQKPGKIFDAMERDHELLAIYGSKNVISVEDASKKNFKELSEREKKNYVISKNAPTDISTNLVNEVASFRELVAFSEEMMSLTKLQKIGQKVAASIPEYTEQLNTVMKFYANKFTYIDGHKIFMKDFKNKNAESLFFGIERDANGEYLPHLTNPTEFFQLKELNPYLQDVERSIRLAAEYHKNSTELSANGRELLSYYTRGKHERSKDFSFQQMTTDEVNSFSRGLERSLLQTAMGSTKSAYFISSTLQGYLEIYQKNRDIFNESNAFLDMLMALPNKERTGSIERVVSFTIQLTDAYHRTKLDEDKVNDAREAFHTLPLDMQKYFIDNLVTHWGPINSNWSGSYIELIPLDIRKMMSNAYENSRNSFISSKYDPSNTSEAAQKNLDRYLYFNQLRNIVDFGSPDLQTFNPSGLFYAKPAERNEGPKQGDIQYHNTGPTRLRDYDRKAELLFVNDFLADPKNQHYLLFPNPIEIKEKGLLVPTGQKTVLGFEELVNALYEIFPEKKNHFGIDDNEAARVSAMDDYIKAGFSAVEAEKKQLVNTARLGYAQLKQRYIVTKEIVRRTQVEEQNAGTRPKDTFELPSFTDIIREQIRKGPSDKTSTFEMMMDDEATRNLLSKYREYYKDGERFMKVGKFTYKVLAKRMGRKFNLNVKFIKGPEDGTPRFDGKNNTVYLNVKGRYLDEPFHEFLHPFYEAITTKHPGLAVRWENSLKVLAMQNAKDFKAFEEIIESYKPSERSKEMFTYFVANMLGRSYNNKSAERKVKELLVDLIDYTFDGMGWLSTKLFGKDYITKPIKYNDLQEFKNFSIQDIINYFEDARRLSLSDYEYANVFDSKYSAIERILSREKRKKQALENKGKTKLNQEIVDFYNKRRFEEYDNELFEIFNKIENGLSTSPIVPVKDNTGTDREDLFWVGNQLVHAERGTFKTMGELLKMERFNEFQREEYGVGRKPEEVSAEQQSYYGRALNYKFANFEKHYGNLHYIFDTMGMEESATNQVFDWLLQEFPKDTDRIAAIKELHNYLKETKKHINRDISQLVNSLRISMQTGIDIEKVIDQRDPIFRHVVEPKVAMAFIKQLRDVLQKVSDNEGIDSQTWNVRDMWDEDSGIIEFPSFIAHRSEAQGGDVIVKIVPAWRKMWNNDENSTYYRYIQQSKTRGKTSQTNIPGEEYVIPFFVENGGYTHSLGTEVQGEKRQTLRKNAANQYKLEAAGIAKVYETSFGRKAGNVLFVPIQFDFGVDFVQKTFLPEYKLSLMRNTPLPEIGKSWHGQPIQELYAVTPSVENGLKHGIDDYYQELGNKISSITSQMRNYDVISNKLQENYASLHPRNLRFNSLIGTKSVQNSVFATAFLTRYLGKPINDATLQDIYDKTPLMSNDLNLRLTSMGFKIEELKRTDNEILMQVLIAMVENSRPDVNHAIYGTKGRSTPAFGALNKITKELEIYFSNRLKQEQYGLEKKPSVLEMLEVIRQDPGLITHWTAEIEKYDQRGTAPIRNFLWDAANTQWFFQELKKEHEPGYRGPRQITTFLAKMFQNSPEQFGDFASGHQWQWMRNISRFLKQFPGQYALPTALMATDTFPGQVILGLTDRIQIKMFNEQQDMLLRLSRFDTKNIHPERLIVEEPGQGMQMISLQEAIIAESSNKINSEELELVRLFHSFNKRFIRENEDQPMYNESQRLDVHAKYEDFWPFIINHAWMNPIKGRQVWKALQSNKYDMVPLDIKNRQLTFAQWKYERNVPWNDVVRNKTPENENIVAELLRNYEIVKSNYEDLKFERTRSKSGVGERSNRSRSMVRVRGQEGAVLYKEKEGNMSASAFINGMFDFYRRKMVEAHCSAIQPQWETIISMYENNGGYAAYKKMDLEHKTLENPKIIEKILGRAYSHDLHRESVDALDRSGLTGVVDFLLKWNAYASLGLNLHAQEYNFLIGQFWNVTMEPKMFLEHLMHIVAEPAGIETKVANYVTDRFEIDKFLFLSNDNKSRGFNPIKLGYIMANNRIGVAKNAMSERMAWKRALSPGNIAMMPMTFTERTNQSILTYGFIRSLNEGGRQTFKAYDNMGLVIPGMEKEAMSETEVQMLRFFIEGIQGYYGFSRGQYAYYAAGRVLGMFRFPWQIALLNNLYGRYKIDATQMERVGILREGLQSIGQAFSYALRGEKWYANQMKKASETDEFNERPLDWVIKSRYGFRDSGFRNRFKTFWTTLPDADKKAAMSAILWNGAMIGVLGLSAYLAAEYNALKKGKHDDEEEAKDAKKGFALNAAEYLLYQQSPGLKYARSSRPKKELTEAEFAKWELFKRLEWQLGNIRNDITGTSVLETYKNPTVLISRWRNISNMVDLTVNAFNYYIWGKEYTPKEAYTMFHYTPQSTRPGFPIGANRLVYELANSGLFWGLPKALPEWEKYKREFKPSVGYNELQNFYNDPPYTEEGGQLNLDLETPATTTKKKKSNRPEMGRPPTPGANIQRPKMERPGSK